MNTYLKKDIDKLVVLSSFSLIILILYNIFLCTGIIDYLYFIIRDSLFLVIIISLLILKTLKKKVINQTFIYSYYIYMLIILVSENINHQFLILVIINSTSLILFLMLKKMIKLSLIVLPVSLYIIQTIKLKITFIRIYDANNNPFLFLIIVIYLFTIMYTFSLLIKNNLEILNENKITKNKLFQIQKSEILYTFTAGLLHDFNNMLGAISSSAYLLEKMLLSKERNKTYEESYRYIQIITDSSDRATNLSRQLLSLTYMQEENFSIIDVNKILIKTMDTCRLLFDKSINIISDLNSTHCLVKGIEGQLEQVFLNICINSLHAMTIMRTDSKLTGGLLTVSIKNFFCNKKEIDGFGKIENGNYWEISFKDNGQGIKQESINEIFNPYYTTKKKSIGTGLGLSMALDTIKRHDGFICVNSKINKGTKFNIYLPKIINQN